MPRTKNAASAERGQKPHPRVVAPPARDVVALRAYELFEERGREPGLDLDDWLRAEREVHDTRRNRA